MTHAIQGYPLLYWLAKLLGHAGVAAALLWLFYFMAGHMSPGGKAFWTAVFSDGGIPSWSRIASGAIVAFGLGWISFLVIANRAMPDLSGIALLIGTPYGINVAGKAAAMIGGPKTGGSSS